MLFGGLAAAASDWAETEQSRLRLISEVDGVKGHDTLLIGLQVQLAPGWKIYWRSPGDAGIPPQFDWTGSKNLKQARIFWPLPEMFHSYGFSTWGYHDEVVFPIKVTLEDLAEPLELKLHLFYGICQEVCIPYQHDFALTLGAGTGSVSADATVISEFMKQVPPAIGSPMSAISQIDAEILTGDKVQITAASDRGFKNPNIIVEGKAGTVYSLLSFKLSNDGKTAAFAVKAEIPDSEVLKGQEITITVFDKDLAAEETQTLR